MHVLIIEIISRVSYLVLCYAFLNTMAYVTYGWQWEYALALLFKANQNSDYNFCESIFFETFFFQTSTGSLDPKVCVMENDDQKTTAKAASSFYPLTPPFDGAKAPPFDGAKAPPFDGAKAPPFGLCPTFWWGGALEQGINLGKGDITKVNPITHSSFCWNALWLTHIAYIFPMEYCVGFSFAIYAMLLLAKACMHLQSFLNPGQLHGFFSVTVYSWCLLALYSGFTNGWLFLACATAEFAIEPIDCELKPILLQLLIMTSLQTRSEITIKDNSGFMRGRVINATPNPTIGSKLKLVITKSKSKHKKTTSRKLQDVLVIQTKRPVVRLDGSTIRFNANSAVVVNLNKHTLVLGFKRVNTCVPFEVKRGQIKGSANVIKLAKALL
jgi:ribosomal protein L14